jgi:photosystem II stability/assembly factor-like uncharacterized protein
VEGTGVCHAPLSIPICSGARRATLWVLVACAMASCNSPTQPSTASATAPAPTATTIPISGPPVTDHSIVALHMIDEDRGWAVSQAHVLRTADGGSTWHDITPAGVTSFGYAATAFFLDELHAWILIPNSGDRLQGILYRTADGGATWSESPAPFGGGTLQFLDAKQGWMMAALGVAAGSMAVAIYQTEDAGQNWHENYINDPTQVGAGDTLPLGGLKSGIWATSMQRAWIGGVTYAPGTIYLFETTDAGHTWKNSALDPPPGYSEAQLETPGPVFVNSRTAYLPVHITSQYGVLLAVYVTQDGGDTWRLSPAYVPMGGASDFISETAGFVWNGSNFYLTIDSARSWTTITPDVTFTASFAGMDFVSPRVGYVLWDDGSGGRRLYKTVDGGRRWDLLP